MVCITNFSEGLKDPSAVKELNLNFHPDQIPLNGDFSPFSNIETIKLCGYSLTDEQLESLKTLSNLKDLTLWGCELRQFPHQIVGLEKLEKLNIVGAEFREIPAEIGKLKNLTFLGLQMCEKLKEIPREIKELKELKELALYDNPKLEIFPTGLVDSLPNLEKESKRMITSTIKKIEKKLAKRAEKAAKTTTAAKPEKSKLFNTLKTLKKQIPWAEFEYGRSYDLLQWNSSLVLVTTLNGNSYDNDARQAFTLLSKVGEALQVKAQLEFEGSIERVILEGDTLYWTSYYDREKRYLRSCTLSEDSITVGPEYELPAGNNVMALEDSILCTCCENTLSLFRISGSSLEPLAQFTPQFGEDEGAYGAAIRGDNLFLAGPGDFTGYQLYDISDFSDFKLVASHKGKFCQQCNVQFISDSVVAAFDEKVHCYDISQIDSKGKFKSLGAVNVTDVYNRLTQCGDEYVTVQAQNFESCITVVKLGKAKPIKVGKIKTADHIKAICVIGDDLFILPWRSGLQAYSIK